MTDLYVNRNSAVYKVTGVDGKPIKTRQKKTAARTRGVQGASDEIKRGLQGCRKKQEVGHNSEFDIEGN